MASISVDPANEFIRLVCGAGEVDVLFAASDMYAAYVDWLGVADNAKYLLAMDSSGGNPTTAGQTLDNIWFVLVSNGWKIALDTTESVVRVVIEGDIFPDTGTLFDYSLSAGSTHVETVVTSSARKTETGTSGLTPSESTQLANLDTAVSSRLPASSYTAPPTASDNANAVGALAVDTGVPLATAMQVIFGALANGGVYPVGDGEVEIRAVDGTPIGRLDISGETRTKLAVDP